eukprot:2664715-Prorocentrum_lima.AAC.1
MVCGTNLHVFGDATARCPTAFYEPALAPTTNWTHVHPMCYLCVGMAFGQDAGVVWAGQRQQ